jgi:hypothetical protein
MNTARTLLLCNLAAFSACHRSSDAPVPAPQPTVAVPAVVKKGPGADQLTAGMVEAVSQGKSQLPIKLKFELRQRPALAQALDINIAVLPQIDAELAGIQVSSGDGLTVPSAANQLDPAAVQAGQVYRHDIRVTPTAEGVLLLNLTVSLKHDDMTESRAFSIPVIVGQ